MPQNRRLVRVHESRILTGVCTGLGRYTRIDPVVFRVGFAVLTLAGGSGILLYVAAALLMPTDEDAISVAERVIKRRLDGDGVLAALGALLTACVVFSFVGFIGSGLGGRATGPMTVLTVFALALLVAHSRGVDFTQVARTLPQRFQGTPIRPDERRHPAAPPPDPAGMIDLAALNAPTLNAPTLDRPTLDRPTLDGPAQDRPAQRTATRDLTRPLPAEPPSPDAVTEVLATEPVTAEELATEVLGAVTPAAPFTDVTPTEPLRPRPPLPPAEQPVVAGPAAPRRPSPPLTSLTLLTALGVGAATVPFTSHHPIADRVSIAIAAGLAILGAGLIIASWYGRSRGLVSLGVVLCLALVATSAVGELPSEGRWGEVHWRPATARADQSYRVIVGEGSLDLTALPLRAGQRVRVRAEVSFGEMRVTVPGGVTTEVHASSSLGDVNVAGKVTSGPRAKVDVVLPADGKATGQTPVIELFLRGRIGDVEVRRVSS